MRKTTVHRALCTALVFVTAGCAERDPNRPFSDRPPPCVVRPALTQSPEAPPPDLPIPLSPGEEREALLANGAPIGEQEDGRFHYILYADYAEIAGFSAEYLCTPSSFSEVLDLPNRVGELPIRVISAGAFDYTVCGVAVQKVRLPQGLYRIGARAFAGQALDPVEIPDSVIRIGEGAFSAELTQLYIDGRILPAPHEEFVRQKWFDVRY